MPGGTASFVGGLAGAVLLGAVAAALLWLRRRGKERGKVLAAARRGAAGARGGPGARRLALVENPLLRKQQRQPRPPQGRAPAHAFKSFQELHGGARG